MKYITQKKQSLIVNMLIICISFIVVFFALPRVLLDTDFMWHIKVGEYIFQNNIVPRTNIFGYFDNLKFFAHEWLFDYVIYFIYEYLGNTGILTFVSLNISAIAILINKIVKKSTDNDYYSSFIGIVSIFVLSPFIVARPQIFSYLLLILTIYILVFNFENIHKKFIPLLIITLLLVNTHAGSYPAFFGIFGLYIFSMFISKMLRYDNTKKISLEEFTLKKYISFIFDKFLKEPLIYIYKPLITMLALVPFIAINPYFFEIYTYPFKVMIDKSALNFISEWHPTNFIGNQQYILILVFLIFISIGYSKRKNKVRDSLFILVFLVMSASHVRHLSLLYISLLCFGSIYLYDTLIFTYKRIVLFFTDGLVNIEVKENNFRALYYIILLSFIIYLLVLFAPNASENYKKLEQSLYPTEILNYIDENNIDLDNNILFNDYNYGGWLIRNNIKVFIDGRADVYMKSVNKTTEVFQEYMKIIHDTDGWEQYFIDNEIKFILLRKDLPISKMLLISPNVNLITEDENTIFAEYIKN